MSALVNGKTKKYVGRHIGRDIDMRSASRFLDPERAFIDAECSQSPEAAYHRVSLKPISDLDLMIANGWGDTPQSRLPLDWRTRKRN